MHDHIVPSIRKTADLVQELVGFFRLGSQADTAVGVATEPVAEEAAAVARSEVIDSRRRREGARASA